MIRILIADDHALIREGIGKVLAREADMEVVGEARDGREVVAKARDAGVDLVVMDVSMPGRSGLDAIPSIRASRPKLPILMLTMMPERDVAARAFRAGADGIVSKESAADEVVKAIRHIMSGGKYVSPAVAEQLAIGLSMPERAAPHDALSDREFQIMQLIAAGKSTRQMAEALSLSVNTVATYRRRILDKLNLQSDTQIVRYALEHGLVD